VHFFPEFRQKFIQILIALEKKKEFGHWKLVLKNS
jgi:hypothetical protein